MMGSGMNGIAASPAQGNMQQVSPIIFQKILRVPILIIAAYYCIMCQKLFSAAIMQPVILPRMNE